MRRRHWAPGGALSQAVLVSASMSGGSFIAEAKSRALLHEDPQTGT